jgi:hypothetical protein
MMITKRVAMMFSGYATSDFADPAGAALSMCSVFEDYSDELIKFATDPKTGVQRGCKWPPKIAEVVAFCDERIAYIAKMERFKNWRKGNALMIEGPKVPKPTLEEMEAKYGKDWGIDQSGGKARIAADDKPAGGAGGGPQRLPGLASASAKLLRAFCTQVKTYRRLRGGGEQNIRVEPVHVHEGGQAIVGAVNTRTKD